MVTAMRDQELGQSGGVCELSPMVGRFICVSLPG